LKNRRLPFSNPGKACQLKLFGYRLCRIFCLNLNNNYDYEKTTRVFSGGFNLSEPVPFARPSRLEYTDKNNKEEEK